MRLCDFPHYQRKPDYFKPFRSDWFWFLLLCAVVALAWFSR